MVTPPSGYVAEKRGDRSGQTQHHDRGEHRAEQERPGQMDVAPFDCDHSFLGLFGGPVRLGIGAGGVGTGPSQHRPCR
jgi:hypothetical protein